MTQLLNFSFLPRLESRLERIKAGDSGEREMLINDYIPFIIKTISNVLNRYIESMNSDEYIIGLEAFNEAIDRYDPGKGKFISFASLVIRSRVTDFMRREQRYDKELAECLPDKGDYLISDADDNLALRVEINEFEERLKSFGISLKDLVRESPKHKDTRLNALRIAKHIYTKSELKQELFSRKRLPVMRIKRDLDISEKLINRSRIFIIASVLILDSEMECLKSYISGVMGGAGYDI